MRKHLQRTWIFLIVWLICTAAFLIAAAHYKIILVDRSTMHQGQTQSVSIYWFDTVETLLFGILFALIPIGRWKFRPFWPLLNAVCIPFLLVHFAPMVAAYIHQNQLPRLFTVLSSFQSETGFICGATLIIGLFRDFGQRHPNSFSVLLVDEQGATRES